MRPAKRSRLVVLALYASLGLPALASPPEPAATDPEAPQARAETWYVLELGDAPAGWIVERWWREGDRVITEEEMEIRLARGSSALAVSLAGRFEETADGQPLRLWTRQALGSAPVETTYRFPTAGRGDQDGGPAIDAVTVQNGRERRERVALPEGEWLTPGAARRAVAAHHAAGHERYEIRSLEPLDGPEPVIVTRVRLEREGEGEGEAGEGTRWREETSATPGVPAIVHLDAEGGLLRSASEVFGLEAALYRSDEATARAAVAEGGGELGPEVMVRTLVRPDRPIPEHRRATRAVYELSLEGGEPMPALPDGGAQRVERVSEGDESERLRVTVDTGREEASEGDPVTDAHLSSSLYLDHEDPQLRLLLEALDPVDADPESRYRRARRLSRFVHSYVGRKDLDTGFATASEVARTRRGDCTEHAVLLAALLRAEGIPSRVVTGLVYLEELSGAEEIFGYHMWVQAALPFEGGGGSDEDGHAARWVDFDPTLPWGFDATHIALGHSTLAGDLTGGAQDQRFDRILPLIGKLRIGVVEVETADGDGG